MRLFCLHNCLSTLCLAGLTMSASEYIYMYIYIYKHMHGTYRQNVFRNVIYSNASFFTYSRGLFAYGSSFLLMVREL